MIIAGGYFASYFLELAEAPPPQTPLPDQWAVVIVQGQFRSPNWDRPR